MSVHVEIGSLVLPAGLSRAARDRLAAAFAAELGRLLAEGGMPSEARAVDEVGSVPGIALGGSPRRVGRALARSVYRGLGGSAEGRVAGSGSALPGGLAAAGSSASAGGFAAAGGTASPDGFAPAGGTASPNGFAPAGGTASPDGFAAAGGVAPASGFALAGSEDGRVDGGADFGGGRRP
ncbi:hypothetical protein AB0F81_42335 [Actinoplanes sp. NPDC024001]|uniref:hypothetical protein n=1 Tax=Actinoplanes sp. NPDC024001 TaxID=3154598 RepID=UPI0033F30025